MKVRTGFVSNSSSSSFVVFGVKATKAKLKELGWEEDEWGDLNKNFPKELISYYMEGRDYDRIIGLPLCKVSDGYLEMKCYTVEELSEFKEKLSKYGLEDGMVIMGTRPC